MGSSKLVEFLVALLVGVLAILASLFCIGFLLVEPIKSPPSQQPTVSLGESSCADFRPTVTTLSLSLSVAV